MQTDYIPPLEDARDSSAQNSSVPDAGGDLDGPASTSSTPITSFPLHVFPAPVLRFIRAAARALSCPLEFVAVAVLAALSAAIGTTRWLRVKPGWTESCVLYAALVGEPGSGKSPAMGLAIEPLVAQQEEYRKTFSRRLAAQQKTSNAQATEDPAAAPPPSAPMRHLLSSDSTTEALTVALHEDPHGLLYRQDELTGLIGGFDRYRAGKGNDRQFFLSGWSGSAIDYTRVQNVAGRRTLDHRHVQSPFITILGGIQPDLLGRLADEPGRNDGLTDRFLYCYPPPCPASYTSDGVSDETRRGYKAVIDRLLSPTISLEDDNAIGFTADGQDLWTELAMQHAKAVNEAPASLSGPWRKLGIYAARFALILQRARHAADPASVGQEVDDVSVHGAWQLVEYFKQQVRIVYAHLRDQAMTSRALAVFAWIVSHGGRATARHIYTYGVAACRKSEEVMTVFEWLRDMGLGDYREVSRPSGGKPTVIFEAYKPSTADHCRPERSSRSVE